MIFHIISLSTQISNYIITSRYNVKPIVLRFLKATYIVFMLIVAVNIETVFIDKYELSIFKI